MTNTEKAKVKRTLERKGICNLNQKLFIVKHEARYGFEYALKQYNGGYWHTVTTSYNIDDIFEIL